MSTEQNAGKPTPPKKLTAAQRIAALEGLVAHQAQQIGVLADENDRNRSLISSLAKRINATIEAAEKGPLTSGAVNKLILDENVKELESKVKYLVEQGVLTLDEKAAINENTFVVGRDLDKDGNVANPRVQFAVGSMTQEVQTQFIGHKAGDLIPNPEDDTSFEITEVYLITDPRVNKKFDEENLDEESESAPEVSGSEEASE